MRDVEILVGKIIYPDKIRIAQEIVKNTLRELLSRRDSRGTLDLFEENKDEETRFIARISKLSDNQATQVLRQIGDYINATIITREVVQKIRTEKLRNALRVE